MHQEMNPLDELEEYNNQINHPALSNVSERFFMDGLQRVKSPTNLDMLKQKNSK